ncbi:MAG: hypothetical protein EPN20_06750 [Magnetospirillum sp.]|nr:MAG: hypothetical protein EPN20_06750 [Magnetospirillum sp.]
MTALVGQVVFLDWFHDQLSVISRGYWMYLFITLGAVRLGRHGVLIILLMIFGQAVVGAGRHTGFFATDIAQTGLMNLWFYTIILSVVGMASAVLLRQRDTAELTLRTTIDKLKSTNSELEQFAYVASHDLREPLRMISSYIALLDRRYGARLDADGHEYIAFARDGAQRLDRMVLDLLEFSRVGRFGDPFAPLALAEVLHTAVANLMVAIDEAAAEVTISGETSMIIGSRSELVRLVQNLIENALKYRHPSRPPKISVSVEAKPAEWVVAVADNGIGIASEYFDRIFVIFQRLHTREKYGGTGIGLAICRRIVQYHGGRIWLESVPDRGCTFFFSLPRPERN